MPFSFKPAWLAALMLSLLAAAPLHAQDNSDASILDLLRGAEPSTDTGRRVPFGREEMQLSFAPLVAATAPAVVNVYASQEARPVQSPFAGDPFFEQFFGRRMQPRQQSSLGSGVMVDAGGIVVTNFHVIKDADKVKVALSDGREFESKVLLKEEAIDLAVLKIESPEPLATIAIGDSDALQIGDLVLAIGNPFGVGQTTTSGIVSALARSHIGVSDFGFFIQTDAAINPGNSGGALINMKGEVIGINTAIFSRSGGSIGIGFAIPSNMVKAVVAAAKSGADHFERPFIGAAFEPVTAQIAEALGMARPSGALVGAVVPDGPASKAGLKPGDVILKFNGASIEHVDALGYRIATSLIDSKVQLDVLRQGSEAQVDVILVRTPEDAPGATAQIEDESPFSGAKVTTLSTSLAQRLRIRPDTKGVAIVEIVRGSPAEGLGFRPGDIVRAVNGEEIDSPEKLAQVTAQGGRLWRFTIERGGRTINQVLRF
jgi:Do/DeqQ family serine protease